jgi:hypothetical protein
MSDWTYPYEAPVREPQAAGKCECGGECSANLVSRAGQFSYERLTEAQIQVLIRDSTDYR